MEKLKNLKELTELKSIQEEGNDKLSELEQATERSISLHKIALPNPIPIKDFESIELAKEFGFFTYEEKDSIFHINSIEFLIELRLQQRSTIGHYRFYSEPILILRGDDQSTALGIEYGITDKKINADYFSISEIGLGKIILFEKEEDFNLIKKQIEETLPSIHEIFAVVNNNNYS